MLENAALDVSHALVSLADNIEEHNWLLVPMVLIAAGLLYCVVNTVNNWRK